jgi:Right handed beta helix region/PKD domain
MSMTQTITVSSASQLYAALANAKGGETIKLAAGNYGDFNLSAKSGFNLSFASNVTITSADPANAAVLTGFDLRGVQNLTLDRLVFDYTFAAGDKIYDRPFSVAGGANINITNSVFDGDVATGLTTADNGFGYAIGLSVRDAANVSIAGNEFRDFHRGMTISDSTGIAVTGNDVHSMRMDGMNFSQVQGVLIEGNTLHDFRGSPTSNDHSDMIQFWTSGTTKPSSDIVIRSNILDIGNGSATQSIFMRNERVDTGAAGSEMNYKNVLIENNVITNGHAHGITVGETTGLTIRQNSVLHADGKAVDGADASVEIPKISIAASSTGVTVTGNITAALNGWTMQSGWTVKQNAFVQDQDPNSPGYYSDVFVSSSLSNGGGMHEFVALSTGMIATLGAGATPTLYGWGPITDFDAAFQVYEEKGGSLQTRIFDASDMGVDLGQMIAGTEFIWSFGDGSTAEGLRVAHDFAGPGHYDVKLTVITADGTTDTAAASVGIKDAHLLHLGANGVFQATEFDKTIVLAKGPSTSADGIQLMAKGVATTVARTHVVELLEAEDFEIGLKLDADVKGTTGEVFRIHGSIIGAVNTNGEFNVRAFNDDGREVRLTAGGVKVNDTANHDINIRLDDGLLQLWVDGAMRAQSAFDGTLESDHTSHGLTFGNSWGGKNFVGDVRTFDITVGEDAPTPHAQLLSTSDWILS